MSWVWRGATLDSTEITPLPPRERRGTIWSSLPEYKSTLPSDRLIRVAMAEKLPLASLTPTILSTSLHRAAMVSGLMVTPVLPGML